MEVKIIEIGDAKGIVLSEAILQRYHIQDKVELILREDGLILKPVKKYVKDGQKLSKRCAKMGMMCY